MTGKESGAGLVSNGARAVKQCLTNSRAARARQLKSKNRFPNGRVRDGHGRICLSVPLPAVRRMFKDYKRLGSLSAVARLHDRSIPSVHRLLVTRGFLHPKSRSLPRRVVGRMYWEYVSGLSLEQVGVKFKRTRQSVFECFKTRQLRLRAREFLPAIEYKGRRYTQQKVFGRHRYLRDTNDGRGWRGRKCSYLHHVVWEEHNGPIPQGHKVCFKDGDSLNCAIENLELLTNSEQVRKHATGANQFTTTAAARLTLLVGNFQSGRGTLSAGLKARAV
jgi:HNH endonuclease